MMQVTTITRQGQSVLVEWIDDGNLRRATVPASTVVDNEVDPDTLAYGVAYGLPWEQMLSLRVTPERIADALRRHGIWTAGDLQHSPSAAFAALQEAYSVDVSALLLAVKNIKEL
jgi:hypothetical protein